MFVRDWCLTASMRRPAHAHHHADSHRDRVAPVHRHADNHAHSHALFHAHTYPHSHTHTVAAGTPGFPGSAVFRHYHYHLL